MYKIIFNDLHFAGAVPESIIKTDKDNCCRKSETTDGMYIFTAGENDAIQACKLAIEYNRTFKVIHYTKESFELERAHQDGLRIVAAVDLRHEPLATGLRQRFQRHLE